MKPQSARFAVVCVVAGLSASCAPAFVNAPAQAGVVVVGGLSNFDCTNNTGRVENEFEIELPSVDPGRISSYWSNTTSYKGSGYGLPTATKGASSDGVAGHTSTYVDYKRSGIATPVNFTEHFGINFADPTFMPATTIYTWKSNGVSFNFPLPSVTVATSTNAAGGMTVTPTVVNNTNESFIVQFHSGMTMPANPGGERLSDLVDTNPEVRQVESEPEPGDNGLQGVRLEPGQVLGVDGEAHDPTDSIIVNPQAWLASHPGFNGFGVDLDATGQSALTALSVFAVGANNQRGDNLANVFSAINTGTQAVPEPRSFLLMLAGLAGVALWSRNWLAHVLDLYLYHFLYHA